MNTLVNRIDHSIFTESIRFIKANLSPTHLDPIEQQVLERLIHSSGDFSLQPLLRFSPDACQQGLTALNAGALILTDTEMAAAAIKPMAMRTLESEVKTILDWAPAKVDSSDTRTAVGMQNAWKELSQNIKGHSYPIVVIGSSPTALEALLDLVEEGFAAPSLIIGMPVGFIGVASSKKRLQKTALPQIVLEDSRGGAGLASAAINALLRAARLSMH